MRLSAYDADARNRGHRAGLGRLGRVLTSMLVLLLLAIGVAAARAATAPVVSTEDPGVQAMAAQAYADQVGVSLPVAYERVALQDATAPFLKEVASALGDSYGGAWFDPNDDGKLKVAVAGPLVDASNVEAAKAALAPGTEDDVEFIRVPHSLKELQASQRSINSDLSAEFAQGQVESDVDVQRNAVEIRAADDLSAGESDDVAAAGMDAPTPVVVHDVKPEALEWQNTSCSFQSGPHSSSELFCDPPLRGGPMIDAAGVGCTAGFLVWGNSGGSPFVLTAGHCLAADAGAKWATRFADGSLHYIGYKHSYTYNSSGDFGLIGIENPSGWGAGCCTSYVWVAGVPGQTTQDSFYDINTDGYAAVGSVVCLTSGPLLTTGYHSSCGIVQSGSYTDAAGVGGLTRVDTCSTSGTSGGPVYKNNVAYGVEVANSTQNSCVTLMMPAPNAMFSSNVHV